jgi:hypothetical protein
MAEQRAHNVHLFNTQAPTQAPTSAPVSSCPEAHARAPLTEARVQLPAKPVPHRTKKPRAISDDLEVNPDALPHLLKRQHRGTHAHARARAHSRGLSSRSARLPRPQLRAATGRACAPCAGPALPRVDGGAGRLQAGRLSALRSPAVLPTACTQKFVADLVHALHTEKRPFTARRIHVRARAPGVLRHRS